MINDITLDSLTNIRNELIRDYSQPVRRIEFNPKDYIQIQRLFKELIPKETIQQFSLNVDNFKKKTVPIFRFMGIDLIANKNIERNYMKVIYNDEKDFMEKLS